MFYILKTQNKNIKRIPKIWKQKWIYPNSYQVGDNLHNLHNTTYTYTTLVEYSKGK